MGKEFITSIHDGTKKVTLTIAGGGAEAIGELCRYGGASNTLIDAYVPYNNKTFDDFIGGTPDKYVSENAAAQLVTAAFIKASQYCKEDIISIAATSSLVKENERKDRKHKAFFARMQGVFLHTFELELQNQGHSREDEEKIIAETIIKLINADGVELTSKSYQVNEDILKLYKGQINYCAIKTPLKRPEIIFPGSFNPIHEAHWGMIKEVYKKENKPVNLELSIKNVDKPILTYKSLNERLAKIEESDLIENIIITNAPKFIDKAKLFPTSIFMVGADTAARISNSAYYQDYQSFLDEIKRLTINTEGFIIFPRDKINIDYDCETLLRITEEYNRQFIYMENFKMDHSSTKIRTGKN